jgi:hypothetical protein
VPEIAWLPTAVKRKDAEIIAIGPQTGYLSTYQDAGVKAGEETKIVPVSGKFS